MTEDHANFEVLCALAASGQLTSTELAELHEHCERCLACRRRLAEMAQLSAQLFCALAQKQPEIRMPENMLERFITRANSEGVALSPRAASVVISGPGLTFALVLALLLVAATLHLGLIAKSPGEAGPADVARVSRSVGEKGSSSLTAPGNAASKETRASRTHSEQNAGRNRRVGSLPVSRVAGAGRQIQVDSASAEHNQFDMATYVRNFMTSPRPFPAAVELDQIFQWPPPRYRVPKLDIAEPSDFAKDDPPRLFAEYERRTVAPAPPDAQNLRRDFDPDAFGALLSSDLKGRPPAFQFTRESSQ